MQVVMQTFFILPRTTSQIDAYGDQPEPVRMLAQALQDFIDRMDEAGSFILGKLVGRARVWNMAAQASDINRLPEIRSF